MNLKIENEKKEYVAPSMDVLSMGNEISLLSASDAVVDIECIEGYNDEFN